MSSFEYLKEYQRYLQLLLCQEFTEHLNSSNSRSFSSHTNDFNWISCISNPVSIRPVATVPRPVIENTSSTGIKKGFATSLIGSSIQATTAPSIQEFWYPSWIIIQST
jgi:hypothetical protein